jgi:hypothetical protein
MAQAAGQFCSDAMTASTTSNVNLVLLLLNSHASGNMLEMEDNRLSSCRSRGCTANIRKRQKRLRRESAPNHAAPAVTQKVTWSDVNSNIFWCTCHQSLHTPKGSPIQLLALRSELSREGHAVCIWRVKMCIPKSPGTKG